MGWKVRTLGLSGQIGQTNWPLPETTSTLAAVACPDAAGAKTSAITNAVTNVVRRLSTTTSWFTWEHWLEFGGTRENFSLAPSPSPNVKKRGEPKLPPSELNRLLWLVSVLLADGWTLTESRSGTGTKVGNDERQVAHGEVTRTNIADERKAVSKLEVADGERIALEGWGHCWVAESVGPNRAGRNVGSFKGCRRSVRSGGGAAVEGERPRAVLCAREVVARGERIHRGIRNRHTRVEASLIGDVRIEQNGTAHTDGQDGVRGGTAVTEARDGQGGRGRASRGARGRRSVGEGHRRRARQRRIRGGSRREGEADGEREAFDRVRVGVHHFPYRSTTVGSAVDGNFRRVVTCHGRESPAGACTVADGFTGDELGQTDVGGAIRGVGVTGEAAGIGKGYGRSDVV